MCCRFKEFPMCLHACHLSRACRVNNERNPLLKEKVMNKLFKSSSVLASVMAMILCRSALADDGRYDHAGHPGGPGWDGHHQVYHSGYAPHRAYYDRGYHQSYYPHYYRPQPPCGTCSQKRQHHHNNHDHEWWHFW